METSSRVNARCIVEFGQGRIVSVLVSVGVGLGCQGLI